MWPGHRRDLQLQLITIPFNFKAALDVLQDQNIILVLLDQDV